MSVNLANWIAEHKIDEVECIVPDINGVQRGKVLPAKKNSYRRSVTNRCASQVVFLSVLLMAITPKTLLTFGTRTRTKS